MKKNIISLWIPLLFVINSSPISPAFSMDKQSDVAITETTKDQTLLSKRDELRKVFMENYHAEANKIRAVLELAKNEEKKKITEKFRIERLKKIEEFQTQDEALTKEIESTRLKK